MTQLSATEFAKLFDHTLLRPDATRADFVKLCDEARQYGFAMVAINPLPVKLCKELLTGSQVHVGAAISFPLGQNTIDQKAAEATSAIQDGADEIDYVVNLTAVKDGDWSLVEREMRTMVDLCRQHQVVSKVIFENCYLTDEQKRSLAEVARAVEPDFIKTSTGFGTGGATPQDVALMRDVVGDKVKIKAAGGVRTLDDALRYVGLGVSRIGSSSSVRICDAHAGTVSA